MAASLSENVSPVLSSRLEFGQSPHEKFDLLSKNRSLRKLGLASCAADIEEIKP